MTICKFPLVLAFIILLTGCATTSHQTDNTTKTSLTYKAVKSYAAGTGQKELFSLDTEALSAYLETHKTKESPPPKYITKKFAVTEKTFSGRPCYQINPRKTVTPESKAIFFIHGGGFVYETMDMHWKNIEILMNELSIPIWLPAHPLLPDATIEGIVFMLMEAYADMRNTFPDREIIFLGDSSGADLALVLCQYIKALSPDLPLPDKLILISPALIIDDNPLILNAMFQLEKEDVICTMKMLETLPALLKIESSKNVFFKTILNADFVFDADFTGMPPTYIFSGTQEMFFPQAESLIKRLEQHDVYTEFVQGAGMMHSWPYLVYPPESKKALFQLIEIIRR
ncbi:esterase [Spirochaetia bacterium]|nr:esterase [Spirochaetia bacterium]